MNKQTIVAAMLGLAVTGCANTRKAVPPQQPVGMTPIPSLHETINRGVANPAIARATLPDPNNPNWSGRSIPPGGMSQSARPKVATTTAAAAGVAAVLTPGEPPAPFPKLAPVVATHEPTSPPSVPAPANDPAVSPSSISRPMASQPLASEQPASQTPAPMTPGEVVDTQSLPPVADNLGMPDLSKPLEIEPYASPLTPLEEAPAAAAPETAPAPEGSPTAPGAAVRER